jgi:putative DNA primase/helicase
MNAAEIAVALGAAHRSGQWWRCLCPVHGSRSARSATLALRDGDRGLLIRCWAGCDPRDVLVELRRRRLTIGEWKSGSQCPVCERPREPNRRFVTASDNLARLIKRVRWIWHAAKEARGSPVTTYLAERGIIISPPSCLRWAAALRRPDGAEGPAMIARIDGPDGTLIGIQRTWLTCEAGGVWRRRDRAMLGRTAHGAVRLAAAAETLLVGEGIESVLAAMQATAMPGWAALSTSGLVGLALPSIVRTAIILADHDANGAGERAARIAAARWLAEGRRVRIAIPAEPGTDMADVLAGRAYARIVEARDAA